MKAAVIALALSLILCVSDAGAASAQTQPPTPTAKILAIGTINAGVDPAKVRAILPTEVRETV